MRSCKFFVLFLAVCLICLGTPTAKAAEETAHSHCVCGGSAVGVHDHQCADIEWTALSEVVTLTAVDWKNVPSGNYYLDGDVTVTTVTDGNSIGQITKQTDGTYQLDEARTVSLCLNGHSIATKRDRVFKGIYMDSVLNICDCSGKQVNGGWQWDGTIEGGTSGSGGIFYTYANSTVNLYGGNFVGRQGHAATHGGALFYIAQDRSVPGTDAAKKEAQYASTVTIYNGNYYGGTSAAGGGNIVAAHCSKFNVYGGFIHDGTAQNGNGGNIYVNSLAVFTIQNATVYNGRSTRGYGNIHPVKDSYYTNNTVYGGYPEAVKLSTDSVREYTLADALKKLTADGYLQLQQDLTADTEISGTVYLDMNGCDLSGVTVSGAVYGFDSATDSYTGDDGGKLTGTVTGQVLPVEQYLMVNEEGYSFHRYDVKITHLSLKPANAAMGYKAQFFGDDAIARNISGFGYEMWLEGYNPCTYSSKDFSSGKVLTLRLQNILSENNTLEENLASAEKEIFAKAFIQLSDGTKVSCDQVSYNFKDVLNLADDSYADYTTAQKNALQAMAGKFSETMMTWDVENFHHADGGMWTEKNGTTFIQALVKDGSYYKIPAGSYVLTGDVNIQSKTLKIATGDTVNICLNGHTISGTKRMMRIYGTLNLCDCHAHGDTEGGMTSSFDNKDYETAQHGAVFYTYYGSTFNLYGGNLKATGTLATSGVGAVSHEATSTHPDAPAGVMNMYGGTISGGKVTEFTDSEGKTSGGNGGLLSLFHGATFNMYGGEMYAGTATGNGGAICAGDGCSVKLYGGSIYDCSAAGNGGGVYVTGSSQRCIGKDVVIRDNAAAGIGGNVYLGNSSITTIDGATLEGVYVYHANVILAGQVDVGMYLDYMSTMDTEAMSGNSTVNLQADVYGFLADNTALVDCFTLPEGYGVKVLDGKLVAAGDAVTVQPAQETFRVGHGSVCINPAVTEGIPLSGFGNSNNRLSTGVQEDLYANATAITDQEGMTLILITYDLQRPQEAITNVIREHISKATGVPFENIILSASHSHSTPDLYNNNIEHRDKIEAYKLKLYNDVTQAAIEAMATRVGSNAQIGGIEEVKTADGKHMNFTRHYYYYDADGNIQYCGDNFGTAPAAADRTADKFFHVAEGDHSLQLIRFDRGDEKDVVLCNWAAHPTMTGGSGKYVISADYVGPLRDKVQAETDCYFSFVQGAAGNMNPTSRITGETPYTKEQYDQYGEALAGFVLEGLEDMQTVEPGLIQAERMILEADVFKHSDEELDRANAISEIYYDLPEEERAAALAQYGFSSIYHAGAVRAKAGLNDTENLELNAFSIGSYMGFYSLPGELWAESALKVKESSQFASTFTVGYTNGDWKYFLDGSAADGTYENYEYYYCRFVLPETTQEMIAYWQEALDRLHENT